MKDLSQFSLISVFFLSGLSMVLILVSLSSCNTAATSSSQRVGGTCTYKQYKGDAQIVSIVQRPGNTGEYEIKFSFHPQETIKEVFAQVQDKQWLIVQKDSSYPKEDFLTRHGIKIGKRFPCHLNVITKGTCTPNLFDLPTIGDGKVR